MSIWNDIRQRLGGVLKPRPAAEPDAEQAPDAPRRPDVVTLILVAMLIVGLGIIAYPTFSDWWNSYHQTRAIAVYAAAVEEADPKELEKMLADAHAYNKRLLTKANRYELSDEEKKEYQSILDLTGTGVIGYVTVQRLGINYPIYHGIEEKVLQIAIGHLPGTSMPVGGETTHAVVTGHRGLPRAKLFTNLDQMVEGDTFTITVLNQTLTYEVDQIRIVNPEDLTELEIKQGGDYCTLFTCTPYGINTHRMLVRGHRVSGVSDLKPIPADAVQIPSYVAVPAAALPLLFIYLASALVYYQFKRKAYDKENVMRELEALKRESAGANKADDE